MTDILGSTLMMLATIIVVFIMCWIDNKETRLIMPESNTFRNWFCKSWMGMEPTERRPV